MKSKFDISNELKKKIEDNYNFEIKSFKQLEGGFANFNFQLNTSKGLFFLRIHDLINDIESIKKEHKLINFLEKNNFKTAKVNLTKLNNSCFAFENKVITLFTWIDGEPINKINSNIIKQVAQTLAKYHKIVKNFKEDIPKWGLSIKQTTKETINHQIVGFVDIIFEDMPWEKSAYKILEKREKINEYEKYMIENKDFLQQIRKNIIDLHNRINFQEKPIIIHGDYWKNNILFKENTLVGVIDFDTARASPAKMELIKGALEFSNFDNIVKFKEFIKDYKEENSITLSEDEINLYVQLMIMWQIGQNFKNPILNNKNLTKEIYENIKKLISCLKEIEKYSK